LIGCFKAIDAFFGLVALVSQLARKTQTIQLSTAGRLCEALGMHLVKRENGKQKVKEK
jgi:hypothetical protein